MYNFANRLYYLRTASKLSQEELALQTQMTKSTISKYEHSQIEPTLSALLRLSSYFNVSLDYMVARISDDVEVKNDSYTEVINFARNNNITPEQLQEALNFVISLR